MNAQDKSLIYDFLNKADCLCSGHVLSDFSKVEFSDDIEERNAGLDVAAVNVAVAADAVTGAETAEMTAPVSVGVNAQPAFENQADGRTLLKNIEIDIARCNKCALCQTRTNTVPGIGNTSPVVLVIGEGPGADEDRSGKPFVGKAGQLLDKMLAAIQLSRNDNCFIANIVKCRPPANRTPLPEEALACAPFLEAQIEALKPKMILAVGNTALHNLMNTTTGIKKLHGQFFDYKGIPLLATFHPSALLRDESLKRPAWEDLKIFRNQLLKIVPDYQSTYLDGGKS